MKSHILAAALLLGTAGFAHAADAVVEEVVVDIPPGFNWTGGYLGLQAGYSWGNADIITTTGTPGIESSPDPDGFVGGVYAGYNYQFTNNVVLGADADIVWSGADGSDIIRLGPSVNPNQGFNTDVNWTGAIRARLGYAVDRWMPYVAGGVAFADVDHTAFGVASPSFSETYTGWTIGGGVDYAFTDNLIFRAEYRFNDYGDADFPETTIWGHNVELKSQDVRFGLSYKF